MAVSTKICRADTNANSMSDLRAFLNDKSLITLEKYAAAEALVFTTPLTSKVLKMETSTGLTLFMGDAWTSGTTITNESGFANSGHDWAEIQHCQIIADSNFFLIHSYCTGNQGVAYVGALTNGDVIVFGLCTRYDQNSSRFNWAYNLTTGNPLMPISFGGNVSFRNKTTGGLFTMPLMWVTPSGDLQMDGSVPAGTVGVKVSSIFPRLPNGNLVVSGGDGYILTGAPLYRGNLTDYPLGNSLLIPIE